MKISMKRFDSKKLIILFLLGGALLLLFLHTLIPVDTKDDAVFAACWNGQLWSFLKSRYGRWTSRVVIEAALIPLAAYPEVWRILNVGIILLFVWNTADLFGVKSSKKLQAQCILFALIWTVSFDSLCNAGWIATTVNYLWSLSLGTVALRPAKHFFCQERCEAWEYAVCPVCMVYAANMEQMCAILIGIYLLCGIDMLIKKRRQPKFYYALTGLLALSVCFILACPGNQLRYADELEKWFPEFETLSFAQKLLWGFIGTVQYYMDEGRFLFMLLPGVLLAQQLLQRNKKLWKMLAALFCFAPYFYWLPLTLWEYFRGKMRLLNGIEMLRAFIFNTQLPGISPYNSLQIGFQIFMYLMITACVALTVFFVHGRSRETLLQLLILGAGFGSRVILGFTPVFFTSGSRTAIYASAAIMIVVLRNVQLYLRSNPGRVSKIILFAYFAVNIFLNISNSVTGAGGI